MNTSMPQGKYTLQPGKKRKGPGSIPLGILAGFLFPAAGLLILYFAWGNGGSLSNFFSMFINFDSPRQMTTSSKALSLAVITNLLPFYYFLNRKQYNTVRGLLLTMVLFLLMIVMYKYVLQ
jgi:hypothetical protein